MEYSELIKYSDNEMQQMAREIILGRNFKMIDGWVLYVYNQPPLFNAMGFHPDSPELAKLYNEWKTDIYNTVRSYLKTKKEEFASKLSYCTPPKPWGEEYGYTLADPYTLEEIEAYEKHIDERLPEDLRKYLLYVSREFVYDSSYPQICHLTKDNGICKIPEDKDFIYIDYDNDEDETDGMLRIAEDGCAFNKYIVVKGSHKGTIWWTNGDSLMLLKNDYFSDLIKEATCKDYR